MDENMKIDVKGMTLDNDDWIGSMAGPLCGYCSVTGF
jgi:hypothetical protein